MDKEFVYEGQNLTFCRNCDEKPDPSLFKMHTHEHLELYCFLKGKGVFRIEGNVYPLHYGDVLIMRGTESHYIDLDSRYPYERIAMHFSGDLFDSFDQQKTLTKPFFDREAGKMNLFCNHEFKNEKHLTYFNAMSLPESNTEMQILSNLIPLLHEMSRIHEQRKSCEISQNDPQEYRMIQYINNHLTEPITLDEICEKFFVSKPQLCRIFKKSTGSTVWEYITVKRLLAARKMILAGAKPTLVYSQFGFSDYSVFYRAYRKQFGAAPSNVNAPVIKENSTL